jgi:serine/threonine protein phosphatase PrpC
MIQLRHAAASDPGLVHKRNEDCWYANADRGLYFVTDGMANEVTPHFIVETLPGMVREEFAGVDDVSTPEAADRMQSILRDLNHEVQNQRLDLWTPNGAIGATLVLILARGACALIAHLGDSRIYLHGPDGLSSVTKDHSSVQRLLDSGMLTVPEVLAARSTTGPTRFIGMPGEAEADIQVRPLKTGERYLLCSDGLTDMLLDEDIAAVLNRYSDMGEATAQLIKAANAAGGHDNITAMLVGPA